MTKMIKMTNKLKELVTFLWFLVGMVFFSIGILIVSNQTKCSFRRCINGLSGAYVSFMLYNHMSKKPFYKYFYRVCKKIRK